jgi:hypothetical protein
MTRLIARRKSPDSGGSSIVLMGLALIPRETISGTHFAKLLRVLWFR